MNIPIPFNSREPLLPGPAITINGAALQMPAMLMVNALAFAELTELFTDSKVTTSQFIRQRNLLIEQTLRRNYPDIPDTWFAEVDSAEYLQMAEATREAAMMGEQTPVVSG